MKLSEHEKKKIAFEGYFGQKYFVYASLLLIPILKRLKISPNHVTLFNMIISAISCLFFLLPVFFPFDYNYMRLYATIFWLLALFLDFVDGSYARAINQASNFGKWLDTMCDYSFRSLIGWMGFCVALNIFTETGDIFIWFILFALTWSRFTIQTLIYWKPDDNIGNQNEWKWRQTIQEGASNNPAGIIFSFVRTNQALLFGCASLLGFFLRDIISYSYVLTVILTIVAIDHFGIFFVFALTQGISLKKDSDNKNKTQK